MSLVKKFDDFKNGPILIIVDVQKSFSKFFTKNYLKQLKDYCKKFSKVYQIFDNHVDGKNVDKDYLYDEDQNITDHHDIFDFPNQIDIIEKRYNYDVDVEFYRKILDEETFKIIKNKEVKSELKEGDFFKTKGGTIIVYIGNNHKWYHVPKKLYNLFISISEAQKENNTDVVLVGGSKNECLKDIEVTAKSMGLKIITNYNFVYSATNCPIP